MPAPRRVWELRYAFAEAPPSADVVLTLDGVTAAAGDFVVGPVDASVERGDRVALVGANGSGKSTLLRAILGELPASGRLSWGSRTAVGVIDQRRDRLAGHRTVVEAVADAAGLVDPGEARTLLAKFGLGADAAARPASTLTPGEHTRAQLALLATRPVNVLVLDEPTNHADVEAIEQLEAALRGFAGTLLLVTHDRRLAEAADPTVTWTFTRSGERAAVAVHRR